MLKSWVTSFSTSLRIGLSKNGVAMLRISGWRQRQSQLLFEDVLSNDETLPLTSIAAQMGKLITINGCEGLAAEVIVADEWVRIFIVTPPRNCSRIEDYRAAASMRFQSLYGEGVSDWYIGADWDPRHPFLACALPQSLRSVLVQIATEKRLTLTSILPHFIAAWNCWHRQLTSTSWFGVVHGNNLTLGVVDQKRLCNVRTVLLPDNVWNDPQWLPDYIFREALRLNVSAVTSLQLCGEIPVKWATKTIGAIECMRLDGDSQMPFRAGQPTSLILVHSGLQQ